MRIEDPDLTIGITPKTSTARPLADPASPAPSSSALPNQAEPLALPDAIRAPAGVKAAHFDRDTEAANEAPLGPRELPRTNLAGTSADAPGLAVCAGLTVGRSPAAVTLVIVGGSAAALGSGAALATTTDLALPASPAASPTAADAVASTVGVDRASPLALAQDLLFGKAAPASPLTAEIEAGGVLRPGAEGAPVAELQRRLTDVGFAVRPTGRYDDATQAAVRRFQAAYRVASRHGPDGNFGPKSFELLRAGEAVTDAGRSGVGAVWLDGQRVGEIDLLYVNGKPVSVDTANALRPMFVAAARAGHPAALEVASGFRTFEEQQVLRDDYLHHRGALAAEAGYSNHQSGIAVDLNTGAPGVFRWLTKNAASFGFIRTVPSEDWHWEYRPDLARP